jgi:AcrR family transcriptional regulator
MTAATTTRSRPRRAVKAPPPTIDGLTEERIVAAAKAIVREVGVDGLTMRRLSDDLNVALGATYHHVPNRHALLALVARSIQDDVQLPGSKTGTWIDNVRTLLLNYVAEVSPYQGMASFTLANSEVNSPRIGEAMRGYLASAGFSREGSELVLSALFFYVAGTMASGLTTGMKGISQRALNKRFIAGLEVLLKGVVVELKEDRQRAKG